MADGSSSSSDGEHSDASPKVLGPHPQPKQLGLAWEEEKVVRRRVRDKVRPYMTRWINDKAISVPSVKAMSLNDVALVCIAKWWCPSIGYPKAVPIDLLRAEVKHFRELCGADAEDAANVQLDSAGLKKLFSHGIRRFCSGSSNKDPKLDDFYEVLRTYWAESEGAGVEAIVEPDPYPHDEPEEGEATLVVEEGEEPESESSTRVPQIDMYADRVGDDVMDGSDEEKGDEPAEPAKVEEPGEVQRKEEPGDETTEPLKVDVHTDGTTKVEQVQAKEKNTPTPEPSTVLTTPPARDDGNKSSPVSMPPPPVPKKIPKGEASAEKITEVKERIEKLKSQLAMKKALEATSKITCCTDNVETQPVEESTYDHILRARTLELGESEGDDAEGEGQVPAPLLRGKSSCHLQGSSWKGGGNDGGEIPSDKKDVEVEGDKKDVEVQGDKKDVEVQGDEKDVGVKDKSLDKTSPNAELPEHPMVTREDQKNLKESNLGNKPGKKNVDGQEPKPKSKTTRGRGVLKKPAASRGARSKKNEDIPSDPSDEEPIPTQHYSPESEDENSPLKPAALDQQFSEVDSNPPEPETKPKPDSKPKAKPPASAKAEQAKKPKIEKERDVEKNQTKKRKAHPEPEEPSKKTPKTQDKQSKTANKKTAKQDEHLGDNDAKAHQKKTFAGRACPKKNEQAILRHNVMISTFNAKIGPLCVNHSSLELAWWNWAYEELLKATDQSEKGYRKVASERAKTFMQQPQLQAYRKVSQGK